MNSLKCNSTATGKTKKWHQNYAEMQSDEQDGSRDSKSGERGEHVRAIFLTLLC